MEGEFRKVVRPSRYELYDLMAEEPYAHNKEEAIRILKRDDAKDVVRVICFRCPLPDAPPQDIRLSYSEWVKKGKPISFERVTMERNLETIDQAD